MLSQRAANIIAFAKAASTMFAMDAMLSHRPGHLKMPRPDAYLRQTGSHKELAREGHANFVFAFHDGDEIGPKMLARVAKHIGLEPADL